MSHELAGKKMPVGMLVNISRLIAEYYTGKPDPNKLGQQVSFGTSGHRGSSLHLTFNEDHILAITQAICNYRKKNGINGPLFLGMDTHALSEPAQLSCCEVLAANEMPTLYADQHAYTPTPSVSHAIITYNQNRKTGLADGIIVTPSHNPPEDGGIKYNMPHGGPADSETTCWIADEANRLLRAKNSGIKRLTYANALASGFLKPFDYRTPYVRDLQNILNLDAIRGSGLSIAADALGGAGLGYWIPIAEKYGLNLTLFNGNPDPTFRFMPVDHDGKIRMDCSSPKAMAGLIKLKNSFDIAFGNDPDFDRHGIVTPSCGLLNPNHYLAAAIDYLFQHRPDWPIQAAVGKTIVSSSMLDLVTARSQRKLLEVPVGFKWFVDGLASGELAFAGEESAGATFLCKDGTLWSTDKDGIILALLAAEITAVTGKDPGQHYQNLENEFGSFFYGRQDSPATPEQKAKLARLTPDSLQLKQIAGSPVLAKLTRAPGNNAPIGGLKIVTADGWFAIRPSGTENISKVYAESRLGSKHLKQLFEAAKHI
ncbi:MAG: phosphoglucomutase (alpha-D-glucose-1,6-bisphosphate-dependent) [Lentisphaeria bacterium]